MIATYIQELLANNNRVIVPNYGAFLVRATSKSKDAKTLEEKLLDIYFSPFLKFNDFTKSYKVDGKEKTPKCKACEYRGMKRNAAAGAFYEAIKSLFAVPSSKSLQMCALLLFSLIPDHCG